MYNKHTCKIHVCLSILHVKYVFLVKNDPHPLLTLNCDILNKIYGKTILFNHIYKNFVHTNDIF